MNKTRERELNDLELQNKNAVGPNFRGIEERAKTWRFLLLISGYCESKINLYSQDMPINY